MKRVVSIADGITNIFIQMAFHSLFILGEIWRTLRSIKNLVRRLVFRRRCPRIKVLGGRRYCDLFLHQ